MEEILNHISSYSNFPKKGVVFKDLLGILHNPKIFKSLIQKICLHKNIQECDSLIAIDARGFIFGSAVALYCNKPMIVARKQNKLPGKLISQKYKLEYGENSLEIQQKALDKFKKYTIIDDVLASGGTANCIYDLVTSYGKQVIGLSVILEIKEFNSRVKLKFPVESCLQI